MSLMMLDTNKNFVIKYCKIIKFRGHAILWFHEILHVCGHFNLWISNYVQYY